VVQRNDRLEEVKARRGYALLQLLEKSIVVVAYKDR